MPWVRAGKRLLLCHTHTLTLYAAGTPLIVEGTVPAAKATTPNVQPAIKEVGLSLDKLTHKICLSSAVF